MANAEVKPDRIQQLWFAYAPPLMLEAAIRLKVFDVLDAGPKTVDQVASATGASTRGLRALMNGLTSLQFLSKKGDTYSLTPESNAFLVSGKAGFIGGMFKHTSQILPNWLKLVDAVKTGKPVKSVNQEGTGADFFREFVEDLFASGYAAAQALANSLDLKSAHKPLRVLDIAAGSGVWSIAIAKKYPDAHVTVVDWPGVIPVCQKVTSRMGVADRFDYRPGDLLQLEFGGGYQVATLGHILHSEGEQRSRQLLKKVFAALAPGGTIAISEMIPNEDRAGPPHAMLFAINMLVHTDTGDTFTFSEMSRWLEEAGFTSPRKLEVPAPSPLVLATKP
jgi:ubiquinone/menaquinone biosynthesis C-methylase UbiE